MEIPTVSTILINKLKEISDSGRLRTNDSVSSTRTDLWTIKGKNRTDKESEDQTIAIFTKIESVFSEEYHTAKIWARKLRLLKRKQRVYAEKAIYDVLYEAQLGNLNNTSVKINEKCNHGKELQSIFVLKKNKDLGRLNNSGTSLQSSSEMMISESFPYETGSYLSQSQDIVDDNCRRKTYALSNPCLVHNHSKPLNGNIRISPSGLSSRVSSESVCTDLATSLPECFLTQLCRYFKVFSDAIINKF